MNDELLEALVSRIKYAKLTAEMFTKSGLDSSAEMWNHTANFMEGVLFDLQLTDVIKEIRKEYK